MKVVLGCGDDIRDGYLNIDDRPINNKVTKCDLDNLTKIIKSPVQEMIVNGIISRYSMSDLGKVVSHWVSFLAPGGIIYIKATDVQVISNEFIYGRISIEEMNARLFGDKIVNRGIYSLESIEALLNQLGMITLEKTYLEKDFVIRAQKS